MTTDTELRDLLTDEAAGPARHPAGWDDVVQRGRHHRRVTRLRNGLALGSLAAVVAVTALVVTDQDGDDRRPVVADDPEVDPGPTTTRDLSQPDLSRLPDLTAGRVSGSRVTLILGAADPELGFDPCTEQVPVIRETDDEVRISVAKTFEAPGLVHWSECQASPFGGWGTLVLESPLGDRALVDDRDGRPITVVDGAPLLFPTALPAPFDVERWDEFAGVEGSGMVWTFSFSADDMALNVSRKVGTPPETECGVELVEVRGVTGRLCRVELAADLNWTDAEGVSWEIELADVGGEALPEGIDLVAIADGLAPLGG